MTRPTSGGVLRRRPGASIGRRHRLLDHVTTEQFKFKNNGGIPHNLRINGKQAPNIDPGETTTLKVALAQRRATIPTCARSQVMPRLG